MAAAGYVEDVLDLTRMLSEGGLAGALLSESRDVDESVGLLFSTYVESANVRPTIAVLQAMQLAFDAASVVVEAAWREMALYDVDAAFVDNVLRDPLVELTIVRLSEGSFFARFSIDPRKKHGRTRLFAIGGLAALALSFVFGPIPGMVMEGLALLNEAATPDAVAAAAPAAPVPLRTVDDVDLRIAISVTVNVEIRDRAA